jgi:hypothetical protein
MVFVSRFVNSLATPNFAPISAVTQGAGAPASYNMQATTMPAGCTFGGIYVNGTITAAAAANTITVTVMKNTVATSMAAAISVTTLGATVSGSSTAGSFSVAPGDTVALQVAQTNTAPAVAMNVSTVCQ